MIFETAVYCGRLKEWRILNVSTGTVYSSSYDSEEAALAEIEDGEERGSRKVKRIRLRDICVCIASQLS